MNQGKELKTKFFSAKNEIHHLSENDRYLYAPDQPKYKFNVIGTGMIGQEHISVTMLEGRAIVHGVFDPSPLSVQKAKKVFEKYAPKQELVVYDSLEAACHDPHVDGLIICTPNYTHITVAREAIHSGKHILLEKPMTTNLQDAQEILQLTKEYPAIFQIGLQYRYKAIYSEAIHEALERQSIGNIKTISLLEHRLPFIDKVAQWNKFSKYAGGTLVEKCCHYFDLFNLFAQAKPLSVYSTGSRAVNFLNFEYHNEKADMVDNAFVIIIYENEIRANLNLCMFAPMFYEEMVLCGDGGHLKVFESEDYLPTSSATTQVELRCKEHTPSKIINPNYPKRIADSGHNGSTYIEHLNFVDAIEGKTTRAATTEEGFWSIVVGVAAEESLKTGTIVQIKDLLKNSINVL